jgi:hypothetical protein
MVENNEGDATNLNQQNYNTTNGKYLLHNEGLQSLQKKLWTMQKF